MLERYITPLLTSYLDKYVKNIQPTDLQLSFWGGDAVLRNLELRLDVLEKEFGYPLALQSGHIKELRIHVPWTTLGSEPVEISISDVEIVAIVKESWSSGADKSGSQDLSSEVKETIKKTELKQGSSDQAPGYLSGLLNRILSNIVYHIDNFIVKLMDDDIVLTITAKSLESFSTNEFWNRMFIYTDSLQGTYSLHSEFIWSNVVLYLDQLGASGQIEQFQESFVSNFCFTMRTQKDYQGGHQVSNTVNFLSDVMNFSLTETQYCLFMRILDRLFALYYSTKKLKGKDEDTSSPALSSASQEEKFFDVEEEVDGVLPSSEESKEEVNASSSWTNWAWSFVANVEDMDGQADLTTKPPESSFHLCILVNEITIDFKRTCKKSQGVFFAAPKISAQSVILFHIDGLLYKISSDPSTEFWGTYAGFMSVWAELTGECCCTNEGKPEASPTKKLQEECTVLTIGPHGRDMVDKSRLLHGTLFDTSTSVDAAAASHATTKEDFAAFWFSYDYFYVSSERTQEELEEHFDIGQMNVVLCAELVHFWQHFSKARSDSLEVNPSLSASMTVIGDVDAHTEVYTTIKNSIIYLPTNSHHCYTTGSHQSTCVRIDTEGYFAHTSKPMYPGNATHYHIQRTKTEYKLLATTAALSVISEGWIKAAGGDKDIVTTPPVVAEMTNLFVTRHWQDNGADITSSYTELNCPNVLVKCTGKEMVQLMDVCWSWCVDTGNYNRDHSDIIDNGTNNDKLILALTDVTWQYSTSMTTITHSLILHHLDTSMSCDPPTTMPSSKLIRGPVVTKGNKDSFPTNMGTLVLQDCDGNILEAFCAYPIGKGNEKNFSTIRLKLAGLLACFHPSLLSYLKSIPPDLLLGEDKTTTAAVVMDPTAHEPDTELNEATDRGERIISLLRSFVVEINLEPVMLVFPINTNTNIDSIPYDYWQLHGVPTIPMVVTMLPSVLVTSSGGLPLDEPSSKGSLEDTFPWRACVEGLSLFTVGTSCRRYVINPVAMDMDIATVRSTTSTEVGIGVHSDVQPIVVSVSPEQAKLLSAVIRIMSDLASSLLNTNNSQEWDESGFVSQSQPTASLSPSPAHSVITVSTMPGLSIASSQLPTRVPSLWLQLTLSKLTLCVFSADDGEEVELKSMVDNLMGVSSVECTLCDVSCSLDIQEQQFEAIVKVVSADAQLNHEAPTISSSQERSCHKLFSSHTSILDPSISSALSNLMTELNEPEPQSTQHSSSRSFLGISFLSYSNGSTHCKAPKLTVEMKPFELLVWLPIVRYLDGITRPFTDLIGQNKDEIPPDDGEFMWPVLDIKMDCFRVTVPDSNFTSALVLSVDSACLTSNLDYPITRMIVNSSVYKKANVAVHDRRRPHLPAYQLDMCSVAFWAYQVDNHKQVTVLPVVLSCELRVLFSPAILQPSQAPGKVLMVACGNSLEVNISSNVTIFAGQDQINLVSSIIKSTMVPTPSSDSLTDMATVLPAAPSIPYQAVLSGNKITVCLFQSPSPTEQSHSSFKMQPLIQIAIDHPLCTVTSTGNSVQYSISCYDAHINMAGSGKELSTYAELRSEELYCFAVMDTRKGQPQVKTGVMPSLLVLNYSVNTSQAENNTLTISAEIGKPLHITLTPDLVSVFNTVKSYTTIITDSTHTHAPISANTETSVKLPSYTETPINLKLSTSQCLIEIGISKFQHPKRRKSVSDSYPYLVEKGVVLSWSGLNGRFPETGDSSRFALTNKGVLSASGVQLHLVVEQSELPCLCNSHLDVKLYHHAPLSDLDHSEFFITLSSSSLHLLVSNDHIVAANELHTTLTEVLESLHIDNTAAIDYDAINKESKGNTIYEDDLRSGEFVYVFNAGEGSYQEPLPGQIVFNEGKDAVVASSMEWCYHEPRVITSLQVAPVPFNVSSNQAAAMEIQIGCLLQYWDIEEQEYVTLKSFTLIECTSCSLVLDNGSNVLPSSRQWRVVIDEVMWTGESEEDWSQLAEHAGFPAPLSTILSPVVLAASTRIDSLHNRYLSPSLILHSELEKLSVKFIFFNRHRERSFEGYDVVLPSPIEQELFELCATNFSLRSRRWSDGTISGTIRSSFGVQFVDFRDLTWRSAVECMQVSIGVFQQCDPTKLKLEAAIKADLLSLHVSQGLSHTLLLAHHMWSTSQPVTLLTHYIICNDTVEDLHFGQSGTEEDIFLPSHSCHGYCWRTSQAISQELHICLVHEGMWHWTKPFGIDGECVLAVPLQVGSQWTTLFVEVHLLGGLQRVITFRGSWMITSYLPFPVEVGLVNSMQLTQEQEEAEEFSGWGSSSAAADDDDHSAIIPACSSLPSMLAAEDRFAGIKFCLPNVREWSKSYPLSSRTQNWKKPHLLVNVPSKNDGIMQCWFNLVPFYGSGSQPSPTKIILWPLFGAVSHLPFDLTLCSTTYDQVPPSPSKPDQTDHLVVVKGSGSNKPTILPGQGAFTQLPSFLADVWHQLQFVHQNEENDIMLEPIVPVSTTMLHELPVTDLTYEQLEGFSQQWPYCDLTTAPQESKGASARVLLLRLPVSTTQHCTILASLSRTPSNTILLELHPQCLLVNRTSVGITVREKGTSGNGQLLDHNDTLIPSSDELAFGMKWQHYELWSGTVNLSSLAIINEDKDDDDDDPNKPSPFVLVKCHSPDMKVIAEFQVVAAKHRGITVICLRPQFVLLNQTDWKLKACPLQLAPKHATDYSYEDLFPLSSVSVGESWPMLFWHCGHTSGTCTNTICLSANCRNIQWSLPLSLKFVRHSFALPLGEDDPTSTPALITSHLALDGCNYLVVSLDPSPRLLIQNLTKSSIEVTEAGSKGVHAVPLLIAPGCESAYEPPTLAKTYPLVLDDDNEAVAELKMSVKSLQLVFKCTKDRAWSKPIHPLEEKDVLLELPSGSEIHITTFKTQNTHHITLLPTGGVAPALPIPTPAQIQPAVNKAECLLELDVSQITFKVEDDMGDFTCIEEVLRLTCDQLSLSYNTIGSSSKGKVNATLGTLQVDNMVNQCECEVVLITRYLHNRRTSLYASSPAPVLQISCDFNSHDFSHIHNLYVAMEPITIQIEDELLNLVRSLVQSFTIPGVLVHNSAQLIVSRSAISPAVLAEASRDTRPLVISHLKIKPVMLYVSARVSVKILLSCDDSPLSFNEYALNDIFSNWPEVVRVLAAHYTTALIMRAGWVVGSIELIGSPSTLIRSVGTGLYDLVTLPYEGLTRSPSLFIWGISKGTVAFVRQVSSGALRSLTSITGSLSRNMERLSMDEEHIKNLNYNRRNRPATHITSGFTSGASSLGLSILGAIAGIIEQPLQSVQQSEDSGGIIAARGLVVGLGKGLLGVVTKPVGGAMEFVSQTGHGIMHGTGLATMLKRRVSDLRECRKDRSTKNSTTTKYIWKVFCMPHNSVIMSVEAHFISSTGRHYPCLLLQSATTLYVVNTSADTVEQSYQCVHFELRTSEEKWELPKDVISDKDMMLLTLTSRQKSLYSDVSSERVQTYLQMSAETDHGKRGMVTKMAFLCDINQANRLVVQYRMLQMYLLQPDAIFQSHSLASAEWEKIIQLRKSGNGDLSLKASSHSSL